MSSRETAATLRPGHTGTQGRLRERGQVLVIFAGSIVLFVALCAVVVDVSWYWANTLRAQRAADAAALAGAVFLPANTTAAYGAARSEAQKNGYTDGANAVVTPLQDAKNDRQLNVTVSAPVGTFFMRVLGITQIQAVRRSKAEYVLPVPMGSPQNYYGVGEFLGTPITRRSPTAAVSGGTWTNPTRADAIDDNLYAVSPSASGSAQQWRDFNLTTGGDAIEAGARIGRIEVSLRARLSGSGTTTTNCRLLAALSWNGGASWTSNTVATPALTTTETLYSLPDATSTWDGRTWAQGEFTNANFRVRLTWDKPSCSSSRTVSVDTLEVAVAAEKQLPVNDPEAGTALAPQNFWGAIFTKGGVRQNGDYYAPAFIGGSASGVYTPTTGASPTYSAGGYDYTVDFTGAGSDGRVRLFDPIFCATGPNSTSGWYGAGDHWTTRGSNGANDYYAPVAITYRLYHDINNTPYNTGDDVLKATLAYDPAGKTLGDFSGAFGSPSSVQNYGNADKQDCASHAAHNSWVTLANGLVGGMYRINVETSSQAANATVGAENMFAIWVQASGGKARVYGGGRMAGYTQVGAAPQSFFLAQIEAVHAGKTLEIKLFDPGDVAGNARLYIQSPDGNAYNNVTFKYQADAACSAGRSDSCSGTARQYIQTAVAGSGSSFDNSMITITIPLPDNYGSSGLEPPGVPGATAADRAGWWKIYYDVTNANDTTTWMVNILGNPVHLKVP